LAADGTDEEQTDGIAATDAIRLLKKHAAKKDPFFMAVGLFRPHTPFVAPKKYFDLYPLDKIKLPPVPDGHLDALPAPARRSITRKKDQLNLAPELARKAIQAYYASITFADAQLGRILAALDETGLSKNTIVLFTSDHGYHMGEHGHWQKTTLFENATHVPLIIAGPGIKARGATATTPAEMVDFYPTLAELCGLKPPAYLSGRSLVPALRNPKAQVRESAFTQYDSGYSIKTLRYRYSEWGVDGEAGAEFYDHQTDPNELKNLAADPRQKQHVQQLSRQLRQRIAAARKKPAGVTQIQFENRRRVR
jgi:arylsulfatase A-like enzyme